MIIATVAAVAYVGFSVVSSSLTGGISSGTQYDQLAELKTNYSNLEVQYNETGNKIYMMDNIQGLRTFQYIWKYLNEKNINMLNVLKKLVMLY